MTSHTTDSVSSQADPNGDDARPGSARRRGLNWWQAAAAGAVVAAAVNLLIFGIAHATGAGLVLDASTNPYPITAGGVVVSSVAPLAGGVLLAALLARFWPGVLRLAQVVGGTLGVLTIAGPLSSEADGGTRTALATMHVVAGLVAVLALEALRRHRLSTTR